MMASIFHSSKTMPGTTSRSATNNKTDEPFSPTNSTSTSIEHERDDCTSVSSQGSSASSSARSKASNIIESIKEAVTPNPRRGKARRSGAIPTSYTESHTSYLQGMLNVNATTLEDAIDDVHEPVKECHPSKKGGRQGTFTMSQGNYLQSMVRQDKKH